MRAHARLERSVVARSLRCIRRARLARAPAFQRSLGAVARRTVGSVRGLDIQMGINPVQIVSSKVRQPVAGRKAPSASKLLSSRERVPPLIRAGI